MSDSLPHQQPAKAAFQNAFPSKFPRRHFDCCSFLFDQACKTCRMKLLSKKKTKSA